MVNKDLDYDYLHGKVKSINQLSYQAERKNENVVKGRRKSISSLEDRDQYFVFNKQGNYLERTFYADVDDNYKSPGSIFLKWEYSYKKGKKMSTIEYDGGSEFIKKWEYSYDSSGFCIQAISHDASGKQLSKYTFKYNDFKLFEASCSYDTNGQINSKETYTYTPSGKFLTGSIFSQDTLRVYWKFNDAQRIMYHEYYDSDSKTKTRIVYAHDENGNETEAISYDNEGEITLKMNAEYVYDSQLNWIRKIIFENDQPTYVIEREIEYYR